MLKAPPSGVCFWMVFYGYIYIDLLQVFLADLILFQIGFMFQQVPYEEKMGTFFKSESFNGKVEVG